MKTVAAYEAKTHFSRLLDEVANGAEIMITRHGVPVAQWVPVQRRSHPDVAKRIEEWREFRRRNNITLGGISIRELIEEGRM